MKVLSENFLLGISKEFLAVNRARNAVINRCARTFMTVGLCVLHRLIVVVKKINEA
jgi:hypothetical protein